jgi:AcrR family transcriptional regulator
MNTHAPTRLPRAQRESQMLNAAAEEFDRCGFRQASMERIAQAAGITKALIYQYFGSKEGLYTACVERGRADMFEEMAAAAMGRDPGEMLTAVVESYFDQLDQLRGRSYVLYGDAPGRAVDEMRRRNADVIEQLLAQGAALAAEDRRLAAELIVGAGEQVGRWWLAHREVPADRVKARFTAAVAGAIAGLARTGGSRARA